MPTPPLNPRKNNEPFKEKLCVFGGSGIGKTHQYLTIAKWHQELGSRAQFYGVNTDDSWDVLLNNPEFAHLTNVHYTNVEANNFQEYLDAGAKYRRMLTEEDWFCADLLNSAWEAVSYEAAARLAKMKGQTVHSLGAFWETQPASNDFPIKGWDWGFPNARYKEFANQYCAAGPGHRFMICGEKELMKESRSGDSDENPEHKLVFGHIGHKPLGQKDDPHRWHSILYITPNGLKAQKMATAKERFGTRRLWGKKMQNGQVIPEPFNDFFLDYLVGTAGWTMD